MLFGTLRIFSYKNCIGYEIRRLQFEEEKENFLAKTAKIQAHLVRLFHSRKIMSKLVFRLREGNLGWRQTEITKKRGKVCQMREFLFSSQKIK